MWKRWCDYHKTWTSDDWKYVIWSDESSFTLFPTSGWVYVWRTPKESYNPERETWRWIYEVSSNSIQIGIVVVAHWVGCVCNQSSHVRTCLSNSWHKLQVAAFAQLAVVGHGSNMCVYVIAIFTMSESTKQCICIKFCFKIGKTATETETYQLLQQA